MFKPRKCKTPAFFFFEMWYREDGRSHGRSAVNPTHAGEEAPEVLVFSASALPGLCSVILSSWLHAPRNDVISS